MNREKEVPFDIIDKDGDPIFHDMALTLHGGEGANNQKDPFIGKIKHIRVAILSGFNYKNETALIIGLWLYQAFRKLIPSVFKE